ncbi:hypothetical protein HIM_01602 [Hirsutella minnesotensis 3608]|nr:hypothetical protein HIM_01602 [Hirsutella minnesotensis 3608]
MCRLLVFSGACTRCGDAQTWDDLSQQLSCLEAKNNGTFGECGKGVYTEDHDFDQECHRCAEEDEGLGDIGDEDFAHPTATKRAADSEEKPSERKKQKT